MPILKAKTPSPVKLVPVSPNKTSFDAMKPKSKPLAKKGDDIFSDARMDSDGDTSVLSDGQTTDNSEEFNV